jgi:type IX secretion system PorP/SprF family membrane protein
MQINRTMRISGGISFGLMQYKVDGSKLTLGENLDNSQPSDPAILASTKSVFTPDASIGVYLWSLDFMVGVAAHQLFGQKLSLYPDPIGINKLKQHILISGGYIWNLNRYYKVEPTVLIKYMFNSPMQVEVNGKITYKKQMWGGLSYRYNDGMAMMIGYNYKNRYLFGLSYDYSFTSLGHYQVGTIEIMIGYIFDKIK